MSTELSEERLPPMMPEPARFPEVAPDQRTTSKAGLVVLLLKLGPKFGAVLAKLAKGLKVTKVGLAAASMATYSVVYTWKFAAVIMLMLFVHESGHIWAMKRCGLKTKGIYFIPFLGGAAVSDGAFPSRGAEVYIAIMGPIWGFALSALTALGYLVTKNPFFAVAASWMAMINLFNLIPINPLDGGRIMKSIAYSVHSYVGLALLGLGFIGLIALSAYVGFALFIFLFIIGAFELSAEYKRRVQLPRMSGLQALASGLAYVAVAGVLWLVMVMTEHVPGADAAMDLMRH